MFDLKLALVIFAVTVPGIVLTVPRTLKSMEKLLKEKTPAGKKVPPMPVLVLLAVLQSAILAAGFSALGTVFAPKVGLEAPFFAAVASGGDIAAALPDPLPVLGLSAAGSAVFLVLYYGIFCRWMNWETVEAFDGFRQRLGISSRLLYGGIVEEVLTRWGIMPLLAWFAGLVWSPATSMWIAIVVTGIIFAVGHIPSYVGAGCKKGLPLYTTQLVLNLWAALFFGYLFWHYGLLAAMVSHMLFHLIWYPFDAARMRNAGAAAGDHSPRAAEALPAEGTGPRVKGA